MKFRSPSEEPLHVALTTGHTALVTPESVELDPMFHREASARGAIAFDDGAPGAAVSSVPMDRKTAILAALKGMLDGNDPDDFTADGKPNLNKVKAKIARTGGAISSGLNAASRLMNAGAAFAGMAATPSTSATPAPSTAGAGRGAVNPPTVNPAAPLPSQPPAPSTITPGAADSGPAATSSTTAQPRASARDRLMAIANLPPADESAFQPQPIRHSDNDWQTRKNLENARTAASSITNTRQWGGPGAENNPAMQEYRAALATDNALQQAEPA